RGDDGLAREGGFREIPYAAAERALQGSQSHITPDDRAISSARHCGGSLELEDRERPKYGRYSTSTAALRHDDYGGGKEERHVAGRGGPEHERSIGRTTGASGY